MGVTRADERRKDELRVDVGVTESVKKSVRGTWAAHLERIGDKKLANRTDAQKVEKKYRRGRLKLRWGLH